MTHPGGSGLNCLHLDRLCSGKLKSETQTQTKDFYASILKQADLFRTANCKALRHPISAKQKI